MPSPEAVPSAAPPKTATSGLAIGSLVSGVTCIAPAAIIMGHIALSRIKSSDGRLGGRGMAIAGLVLGYLGLASYLFLIPSMFIGARAWKAGSDRAACIITQRNLQQEVRAYQNEIGLAPGDPLDIEEAIASRASALSCPAGGSYEFSATVPPTGGLVVKCSHADDLNHAPADHANW